MLSGILYALVEKYIGDFGKKLINRHLEGISLKKSIEKAIDNAVDELLQNEEWDQDIVYMLRDSDVWDHPEFQDILIKIVNKPFNDPSDLIDKLELLFVQNTSLMLHVNDIRDIIKAFLIILGQEILYIPQLRDIYGLLFQKVAAENSQRVLNTTEQVIQSISILQNAFVHSSANQYLLEDTTQAENEEYPWNNLPGRMYTEFIGRGKEIKKITSILSRKSRHFLAMIDGIGGVGKSALALEVAYFYKENYERLEESERFSAIVWISAKRNILTTTGIQSRMSNFNNLHDLYREIAIVLNQSSILQSEHEQRHALVNKALTRHRVLLIIDNLETVDDEDLLNFIRELPEPTKAIITTRHTIDVAYSIRLLGMPKEDADKLVSLEAYHKNIDLNGSFYNKLYNVTGGIPLAIVWSIGLISAGHDSDSILSKLKSGESDIAKFCFTETVKQIQGTDAYRFLLSMSIFTHSINRQMLGSFWDIRDDDKRDNAISQLIQRSLINKEGNRFDILPLTRMFVSSLVISESDMSDDIRTRWINCLVRLAEPYAKKLWHLHDLHLLRKEGVHLINLSEWAYQDNDMEVFLKILPALSSYYDITGQWSEMLELGKIGLDFAKTLNDKQSIIFISIDIFAWIYGQQSNYSLAEPYILEAIKISKETNNLVWRCAAFIRYSQILRRQKLFDKARGFCLLALKSIQINKDSQNVYIRAEINNELGRIERDAGNWVNAKEHFLSAYEIFITESEEYYINTELAWGVISNLGFVEHQLGELDDAARMYEKALVFFSDIGGKGTMTTILIRLAQLEEARGNVEAALKYSLEGMEWSKKLDLIQEYQVVEDIYHRQLKC